MNSCTSDSILQDYDFTGAMSRNAEQYGTGSGPIFLGEVECSGDESSLFNCTHAPAKGCDHTDDEAVYCGMGKMHKVLIF